jgi:hypothetical protein
MTKALLLSLFAVLSLPDAEAKYARSPAARAEFVRTHPCPTTGMRRGACPGYVVDHIVALCDGGLDDPSNMQWQEYKESKIKDKTECKLKK